MKFKYFLTIFLSLILFLEQTSFAATFISPIERDANVSVDIRNSDTPSNLPVAGYEEFFDKTNENIIYKQDLSQYLGLRGFLGYGLYDKEQDICQFLEMPNVSESDFDSAFKNLSKFNKHTYGISRNRMDYTTCSSLTAQFGGTPVMIDSSEEVNFLYSKYRNTDSSPSEFWVGAYINSCSDNYMAANSNPQSFFYWINNEKYDSCSEDKKYIYSSAEYSKWKHASGHEQMYCLVEWDSPIIYKPIKVCAPWWRVERDYKNLNFTGWNQRMLNRINQARLPQTMNICSVYDESAATEAYSAPSRDFTCTSYYSITKGSECARNIKQPQCFINECEGYVKDVCRLKSSDVVGKGYVKGNRLINGVNSEVKVKDEVTTYLYECPPSPPSKKDCKERSRVTVWPKECPGSQCDQLKECVYGATTEAEGDDCYNQYSCELIYPNRSIPPQIDSNGVVTNLFGTCSDGTQLSFVPNIMDRDSRKCVEYEENNVTKKVTQLCKTERPYSDIELNVAFSDDDIYADNENCIRTDSIEDSQAKVSNILLKAKLNQWFSNKISEAHLDDTSSTVRNWGYDFYHTNLVINELAGIDPANVISSQSGSTECTVDLQCGDFDNQTKMTIFGNRSLSILTTGDSVSANRNVPFLDFSNYLITIDNLTEDECNNYPSTNGFSSYVSNVNFIENGTSGTSLTNLGTCQITYTSTDIDSFLSKVSLAPNNGLTYYFKNTMTKDACLRKAVCIGGKFVESNFGNSYGSTGQCVIYDTTENTSDYMDYLKEDAGCQVTQLPPAAQEGSCKTNSINDTAFSSIDGFSSILVIEDYLHGSWSYYTNFTTELPLQNFITATVNSEDIVDKEVFPMIQISHVLDYANMYTSIWHEAWLKKNPAYVEGAAAGVLTGAGLYGAVQMGYLALSLGPGAAIAIVVAVIIFILLSMPKQMNGQKVSWVLYKHIDPDNFQHSLFEKRKYVDSPIGFSNGLITSNDGPPVKINNGDWIYTYNSYNTGIIPPGDFRNRIQLEFLNKDKVLKCMGYSEASIAAATHPAERNIIVGYPSRSRWNPWKEKSATYIWNKNTIMTKPVNTVYFGADQSISILLPYTGNFKFKAYDRYDNVLGTVDITKDSFVNVYNANSLPFAKIKFGNVMNIAPGINESNSCKDDEMVEWGGGVSGGYYESKTTGNSENCVKSNDDYVFEHAMTKIEVTPLNMEGSESFIINLEKPLPFPNRVYAVTLGKLQTRNYRCYDDFPICGDNDFDNIEGD